MTQENDQLKEIYDKIKKILTLNNFGINTYRKIQYGIQFSVLSGNSQEFLRVYQNKNGKIKIDYSLIKSPEIKRNVQKLIEQKTSESFTEEDIKKLSKFGFPIVGTDESGKGDYFGPLVGAGVYVDEERAKRLSSIGVQDSKQLTDEENLEISSKIKEICKSKFSIIEISPPTYNDLYKTFTLENKNLNHLLAWNHAKVIEELLGKIDFSVAVIDQFSDEKFILSKLQEKGKQIKIIQMHRAEENIAVAAASILARSRFLEKLKELSHIYNLEFPKGSSNEVIKIAKEFINKHGKDKLYQVAKLHFKTSNSVLN